MPWPPGPAAAPARTRSVYLFWVQGCRRELRDPGEVCSAAWLRAGTLTRLEADTVRRIHGVPDRSDRTPNIWLSWRRAALAYEQIHGRSPADRFDDLIRDELPRADAVMRARKLLQRTLQRDERTGIFADKTYWRTALIKLSPRHEELRLRLIGLAPSLRELRPPQSQVHALLRFMKCGFFCTERFGKPAEKCSFCRQGPRPAPGPRDSVKHFPECKALTLIAATMDLIPDDGRTWFDCFVSGCFGELWDVGKRGPLLIMTFLYAVYNIHNSLRMHKVRYKSPLKLGMAVQSFFDV